MLKSGAFSSCWIDGQECTWEDGPKAENGHRLWHGGGVLQQFLKHLLTKLDLWPHKDEFSCRRSRNALGSGLAFKQFALLPKLWCSKLRCLTSSSTHVKDSENEALGDAQLQEAVFSEAVANIEGPTDATCGIRFIFDHWVSF